MSLPSLRSVSMRTRSRARGFNALFNLNCLSRNKFEIYWSLSMFWLVCLLWMVWYYILLYFDYDNYNFSFDHLLISFECFLTLYFRHLYLIVVFSLIFYIVSYLVWYTCALCYIGYIVKLSLKSDSTYF